MIQYTEITVRESPLKTNKTLREAGREKHYEKTYKICGRDIKER